MRKTLSIALFSLSTLFVGCNQKSTQSTAVSLEKASLQGDEKISTPYGELELQHSYLTDESASEVFDAMDFQRASQAYIWSTPLVSFWTWFTDQSRVYKTTEIGEFAVFKSLKEKTGVVTGNLTTPYIITFYDLNKGALEIEYPKGMTAGGILDFWQRPICDLGLTGLDQGKGGKYIIVSPNDDIEKYKNKGAYVFQSETNNIFVGLRLINPDPSFAGTFKSQLKMGVFGQKLNTSIFKEDLDLAWNGTAPRGLEYWEFLNKAIQNNPIREQDKIMMAMLEPLGIKKGQPFNPTEKQKEILLKGAAFGELMTRNLQTTPRFTNVWWKNTNWYKSFDFTIPQITDTKVELDERATWFYEAVTSSEGMVNPTPGKGQVYMTSKRDSKGRLLRSDKTYKLNVPADVPVKQFWSITLYSENTRRPYENGGTELKDCTLGSRSPQLQRNDDGSVDIYIGAKAPKGLESNFMHTTGNEGWFVYFRLYAPTEAFFDKSFALSDWEMIN